MYMTNSQQTATPNTLRKTIRLNERGTPCEITAEKLAKYLKYMTVFKFSKLIQKINK